MGINAFTRQYGFSGKGAPQTLTDTYSLRAGSYEMSGSTPYTYDSQWVSRSGKLSGQVVQYGAGKVRMPTNYDLAIWERSQFGCVETIYSGWLSGSKVEYQDPSFADVAYYSGLWSGYAVKHLSDAAEEAQTVALNRLTGGMMKDGNQASFGSALLQARSTVADIGRISGALLGGIKHALRGELGSALSALGVSRQGLGLSGLSDKFLLWNYGVKPAMGDLHDLHSALMAKKDVAKFLTVSGSSSRSEKRSGSISASKSYSTSVSTSARCKILAEVRDPVLHSLSTQGLINPASIAWDLVPYSFVVDWFVPIGNILRGYESSLGLQFVSGYVSQRTEGSSEITHLSYPITGAQVVGQASTKDVGFHFTRSGLTEFPIPGIYMSRKWMSTTHGAEALALFTQLHSGSRR